MTKLVKLATRDLHQLRKAEGEMLMAWQFPGEGRGPGGAERLDFVGLKGFTVLGPGLRRGTWGVALLSVPR